MTPSLLAQFRMLAGYNRWANRRLYAAAATMSEEDFDADRGAFFRSMKGTLNHLLVADRIWMRRFTGEGEVAPTLDTILYKRFAELEPARWREDERIVSFIAGLEDRPLGEAITYRRLVSPDVVVQPLWEALGHFFNHQTHHRGQAHTVLTISGGSDAAPSLDLLLFQRSDEYRSLGDKGGR